MVPIHATPLLLASALLPTDPPPQPVGVPTLIPIHRSASAPGTADLWAAGEGYKVRFAGGYELYPRRTSTARATPLHWQTTAIGRAGHTLPSASPRVWHDDSRLEYRHPDFVETYEVRASGVEQTFTLPTPIRGTGDLVIVGRVTTELAAASCGAAPRALVFRDASGAAVVRYGEAWALDAAGRRTAVATSFDGQDIRLHVPATWLESATYPVVVDPLTAPVNIAAVTTASAPTSLAVARDAGRTSHNVLVLCTYAVASGDHDAVAYLTNDDYSSPVLVLSEIGAMRDSRQGSVAFVGGADRWVLSIGDRIYFHDGGNLTLNSATSIVNPATTFAGTTPDTHLGGTPAGTTGQRALMVWSGNWVNSPLTPEALGALIDASTRTAGPSFPLSTNPNTGPVGVNNRTLVTVSPESSGGSSSWIAGWREQLIIANDQALFVSRITAGGTVAGNAAAFAGIFNNNTNPQDMLLAGRGGRYMIAYRKLAGLSAQENVLRPFSWSESAQQPVFGTPQPLAPASGGPKVLQSLASNGAASTPGFVLTHAHAPQSGQPLSTDVVRLDSGGSAVETRPLPAGVEATATTFGHGFEILSAERTAASTVTLRGRLLSPVACQTAPRLVVTSPVRAGDNYVLWITKGASMSDNTASQFAISLLPQPSVIPGVISLGIGNQLQSFFIWPTVESYGPGVCAGSWLLPSLPTMAGATVWFQAWFADFAQPSIFPLPVTNVASVTFQ